MSASALLRSRPIFELREHIAGGVAEILDGSHFGACLVPLLAARGWSGARNSIAEALPHATSVMDLTDLRNTLSHLGLVTRKLRCSLSGLDPRLLPCLFVTAQGAPFVVQGLTEDGYLVFDGTLRHTRVIDGNTRGIAYPFAHPGRLAVVREGKTILRLTHRFRRPIAVVLLLTVLLNLIAVVVPLANMVVYDQVIGAGDRSFALHLCAGVALLLAAEAAFRLCRVRLQAFAAARIEFLLGTSILSHILHLPAGRIESASTASQAARIKELEQYRDACTGPLGEALIELPSIPIVLAVLAWIAGSLVLVPVVGLCILLVLVFLTGSILRRRIEAAGRARAARNEFLVELASHHRDIRTNAAEMRWAERHRELSADACRAHAQAQTAANLVQTLSQSVMMGSGMLMLVLGSHAAIAGTMTVGALLSAMLLTWRALSPFQLFLVLRSRFEQMRRSFADLDQLFQLPLERNPNLPAPSVQRQFRGRITFGGVSLRYRADQDPALLGVSFEVAPGEIIGIAGANGSGKSTLLKLVAGLCRPQAGAVMIDGIDIRQIDPKELRFAVSYLPQQSRLFHGTIAQNLRIVQPTATTPELHAALDSAGALEEVLALPHGLETRVGDQHAESLPPSLVQRLVIARALVRQAPILLLDEPGRFLNRASDERLTDTLRALRGKTTVILVSHRPSHLAFADRVFHLSGGRLLRETTADQPTRPNQAMTA
ncbi:MAG TPA: ATP-binding cassette domain-containing protein [Microvirga sp.]|jgi:ATP-binding cassette subfamily C protein/ATP-binding cassette subfamily C protein LapB